MGEARIRQQLVQTWRHPAERAIRIEMHDIRCTWQTYTLIHDPPRREPVPVAKNAENRWALMRSPSESGPGMRDLARWRVDTEEYERLDGAGAMRNINVTVRYRCEP
jgi:hypothetical protein